MGILEAKKQIQGIEQIVMQETSEVVGWMMNEFSHVPDLKGQ